MDNPKEVAFEKQLSDLINTPGLRGIFVSTSKATYLVASILERHNKKDLALVGYDLLEESVPFLKSGTIHFLINQNPKRQALVALAIL